MSSTEDRSRRAYWVAEMDKAFNFMQAIREYPVDECLEPMLSLVDAARTAGVDVSFSAKPHVKGLPRLFWLREGLIDSFIACAKEMNDHGWVIQVEDGFRTMQMQKSLGSAPYTFDVIFERVLWECNGTRPPTDLVIRRINALVAASPKVGTHMSGSAIDISVLHRDTREEVDRGRPYIEMSELTPMDSPFVSAQARSNRKAITALMQRHGFMAYPWEFWHYSKGDAYDYHLNRTGKPARYGAVQVAPDGHVIAIEDPCAPLNSPQEIEAEIARVLNEQESR